MREGKYVDEVYRCVRELPDDDPQALAHLLSIANKVAHDHPVWYERFRLRVVWRKLMGDARNVLKFFSDERKRERANHIVYGLLMAALILATAGIACLIYYVVQL